MRFSTLQEWLDWQEHLHPFTIDMGLERVRQVWQQLCPEAFSVPVITVAGTNGKGSTVAMLEAVYQAAGYRSGAYTSPHLLHYNERIRLQGEPVSDAALCEAFEQVDQARGEISLTYFEFGTLAALWLFRRQALDVVILEVGMGGRLDAVNILDADVAVVTSVALDHQAWLGPDREAIGREKAGIFRAGRPAVCADPEPPASLLHSARAGGSPLFVLGQDFRFQASPGGWTWYGPGNKTRSGLPWPALRGARQLHNAAACLMAVDCLQARLPVAMEALRQGLLQARLAGRFQVCPGPVTLILDVAHNPEAAGVLRDNLHTLACSGRTHLLLGMLGDKDVAGVVSCLREVVDTWTVTGLAVDRGLDHAELARRVQAAGVGEVQASPDPEQAWATVQAMARSGDRIVATGSFFTVAAFLPRCDPSRTQAGASPVQ